MGTLRFEDLRNNRGIDMGLLNIPNNTVFTGQIGSIKGVFKKNQSHIFQLDGWAVWDSDNGFGVTHCVNYQPVHGVIRIERNG